MNQEPSPRGMCLRCRRGLPLCLCSFVTPLETTTRFVLLTHPKEYRRIKNGTGRLTHISLPNSEILVGVDFSQQPRVVDLLADCSRDTAVLYPKPAHPLHKVHNYRPRVDRPLTLFIIDATWPSAKKIMKLSTNLHALPRLSFDDDTPSEFVIKAQPAPGCLSTIEATARVLSLLDKWGCERYSPEDGERFLLPFRKLVETQLRCARERPSDTRADSPYTPPGERTPPLKHGRRSLFFRGTPPAEGHPPEPQT